MGKRSVAFVAVLIGLLVLVVFVAGYALSEERASQLEQGSWEQLVARGLIEGEASYYYDGSASDEEMHHALITAILALDDKIGVESSTTSSSSTSTTTSFAPTSTSTSSPTTTNAPASTTTTVQTVPSSSTSTSTTSPGTTTSSSTTTTLITPSTSTSTTTTPPTTTTTTTTPPNDVVVIPAGVHANYSVEVESGMTYLCEDGAILDGMGFTEYAFYGDSPNVTIQNCEIRFYDNPAQHGAIDGRDGDGWQVLDNEIHDNWGVGVYVSGTGATISGNNIHHQHQLGIAVDGGNHLVENNEIAFNNWLVDYNWGWEAGGTKFWDTDGLVVRGNYSHDNHGPGLWDDYNNINILYEDNLVEDNCGNGIFHEIGYSAIIRNNTLRRNGFCHDVWLWGPGILIAASQDTEVYDNIVEGNYNAITIVEQERFSDNVPWLAQNNYIHDNIVIDSGVSGAITDWDQSNLLNQNNRFENNSYSGDVRWAWEGEGYMTWEEWQAFGNDSTGTFTP